jgi:fluoride exporter
VGRLLLICVGGALGTGLRYVTTVLAIRWLGSELPYGTLIVNLVGSFLIGLIQQIGMESLLLSDDARLFLTTGVMGGLTTYSAFSYETVRLIEIGAWTQAAVNVVLTTVACIILCFVGMTVGRTLVPVRP